MINLVKIYLIKLSFVAFTATLLFGKLLSVITYPLFLFSLLAIVNAINIVEFSLFHYSLIVIIYLIVRFITFFSYVVVWYLKGYQDTICSNYINDALAGSNLIPFDFVLFIRPFDADISHAMVLPGSRKPKIRSSFKSTEKVRWNSRHYGQIIERTILRWRPLVALASPYQSMSEVNARIVAEDSAWKGHIEKLMEQAAVIFCVPVVNIDISNKEEHYELYDQRDQEPVSSTFAKEGTQFELKLLIKNRLLEKTVFIFPPLIDHKNWNASNDTLSELGIEFPDAETTIDESFGLGKSKLLVDRKKYPSLTHWEEDFLLFGGGIAVSYGNDRRIKDIAYANFKSVLPFPEITPRFSFLDKLVLKYTRYLT